MSQPTKYSKNNGNVWHIQFFLNRLFDQEESKNELSHFRELPDHPFFLPFFEEMGIWTFYGELSGFLGFYWLLRSEKNRAL